MVSVFATATTLVLIPGIHSVVLASRARALQAGGEIVASRRLAARAREKAHRTLGYALASLIVLALTLFLLTNDAAIIETFLSWDQIRRSAKDVLRAFWLNLWIALVAECAILVVALSLALIRLSPSRAMAPLRMLAIVYIDVFRAIPLVILLYLVGFGMPLADIPVLRDLPTPWLVVIGADDDLRRLRRRGLPRRHRVDPLEPEGRGAARSGLSYRPDAAHVLVPQAVRRVIPPLLNDFISLQKDTALVARRSASIDAFSQAKIYASNYFNLSPVTFGRVPVHHRSRSRRRASSTT